jgi:hypothetical protein
MLYFPWLEVQEDDTDLAKAKSLSRDRKPSIKGSGEIFN